MNTNLTIKATRAVSTETSDGYTIVAFRPSLPTVKTFSNDDLVGTVAIIELDDETGLFSNHRLFEIDDVTISDDQRVLVVKISVP